LGRASAGLRLGGCWPERLQYVKRALSVNLRGSMNLKFIGINGLFFN